jgi:hypothetical protein
MEQENIQCVDRPVWKTASWYSIMQNNVRTDLRFPEQEVHATLIQCTL